MPCPKCAAILSHISSTEGQEEKVGNHLKKNNTKRFTVEDKSMNLYI